MVDEGGVERAASCSSPDSGLTKRTKVTIAHGPKEAAVLGGRYESSFTLRQGVLRRLDWAMQDGQG